MAEPISVTEAKRHLRVDSATDDTLIDGYIASARDWVEGETGVLLIEQEVTEKLSAFTPNLSVRAWPVAPDAPIEIKYRDSTGTPQSITTATMSGVARPALLYPASGTRWPSCASAISVSYTAGYSDPAKIPAALKQAMLVMLTAFYEDREGGELFAKAEKAARSLCRRYKRRIL